MLTRTPVTCFSYHLPLSAIPICIHTPAQFSKWLSEQNDFIQNIVAAQQYEAKPHTHCLLPDVTGKLVMILAGHADHWALGNSALHLSSQYTYYLVDSNEEATRTLYHYLSWACGAYRMTCYQTRNIAPKIALLYLPQQHRDTVNTLANSIYLTRDLINMPANALTPQRLSDYAKQLAERHHADYEIVTGELLERQYPAVYAVGKASANAPVFVKLTWGKPQHCKVALVGKGVCFDTGGLDLKPASNMLSMKKDMGGAAHVLGLAQAIMASELALHLSVYVPMVENAIGARAMRPSDIIQTRKGLTVEIGNTDAEGRLILADALTEACENKPDLLIDFATLTGAARAAVGDQIAAYFCNDDELAHQVEACAQLIDDPVWRLPLFTPYHEKLKSSLADINNCSDKPFGGAITAALFLQTFVSHGIPWLHFDIMASNSSDRPGRPKGGEAMGLRAVYGYIKNFVMMKTLNNLGQVI